MGLYTRSVLKHTNVFDFRQACIAMVMPTLGIKITASSHFLDAQPEASHVRADPYIALGSLGLVGRILGQCQLGRYRGYNYR